MREYKAAVMVSVFCVSNANADPGLESLTSLLPFYIIGFLAILCIFGILPVWLVFRSRKLYAAGKLTKKKLVVHVAPVAVVGMIGIIDSFVFPIYNSVYFSIFGTYSRVAYYLGISVSIIFLYLAWSTYRRCGGKNVRVP